MTFHDYIVLLWLPIAGGLLGVLLGLILFEVLAWGCRAISRQPAHAQRDYDICEHRSSPVVPPAKFVPRWPDGTEID